MRKRTMKRKGPAKSISVGASVVFGRKNGQKRRGTVLKVNSSSYTIRAQDGRKWRVAKSLVTHGSAAAASAKGAAKTPTKRGPSGIRISRWRRSPGGDDGESFHKAAITGPAGTCYAWAHADYSGTRYGVTKVPGSLHAALRAGMKWERDIDRVQALAKSMVGNKTLKNPKGWTWAHAKARSYEARYRLASGEVVSATGLRKMFMGEIPGTKHRKLLGITKVK